MSLNISKKARELIWECENLCSEAFARIDYLESVTQERVLESFQNAGVAARNFASTTGYGYDDIGRDTLDIVFAQAFQAESALVRPNYVNGTHALFTALAGITEPGDTILFATGKPYDTLEEAIGIRGDAPGSLKKLGITSKIVPLTCEGDIDEETLLASITDSVKVVYFQRSRGYSWRRSFGQDRLEPVFARIHAEFPDAIIMVDNCYCEFCEVNEPAYYGANLMAGSLIKNPGGGLTPTGGYVAGDYSLVQRVAQRLTVPGMGGEVGSYAGDYRLFYQGLFVAPHIVAQCLKTAVLFSSVFSTLGYETIPDVNDSRSDIVQSVKFNNADELISFCQSIQEAAPVDSNVELLPWKMPGYENEVIMAAGTFVQGATSELSADGPVIAPYIAYLQGALTYSHGKIAAMLASEKLINL